METNDGQAWVCLRADLNEPQQDAVLVHHLQRQISRNGPSQQWRCARRAAERAARTDSVNTNFAEQIYHVDTDDDDFDEAEEASQSDFENDVDDVGDEEPLCCQ